MLSLNAKLKGEVGHPSNLPTHRGHKLTLVDAKNVHYEYIVCNRRGGKILTGAGGLITGLISVGIGETSTTTLRMRCHLPLKVASATSVLIVTIVVLASAITDIFLVGIERKCHASGSAEIGRAHV